MNVSDLQEYKPIWKDPIECPLKGYKDEQLKLYSLSPPSRFNLQKIKILT